MAIRLVTDQLAASAAELARSRERSWKSLRYRTRKKRLAVTDLSTSPTPASYQTPDQENIQRVAGAARPACHRTIDRFGPLKSMNRPISAITATAARIAHRAAGCSARLGAGFTGADVESCLQSRTLKKSATKIHAARERCVREWLPEEPELENDAQSGSRAEGRSVHREAEEFAGGSGKTPKPVDAMRGVMCRPARAIQAIPEFQNTTCKSCTMKESTRPFSRSWTSKMPATMFAPKNATASRLCHVGNKVGYVTLTPKYTRMPMAPPSNSHPREEAQPPRFASRELQGTAIAAAAEWNRIPFLVPHAPTLLRRKRFLDVSPCAESLP